jgi:hypothetical protein
LLRAQRKELLKGVLLCVLILLLDVGFPTEFCFIKNLRYRGE